MFNLDVSSSYWWPVKFHVPREDGNGYETHSFQGAFKRMKTDEIEQLQDRIVKERPSDKVIAEGLLVDWREVQNKDGGSVSFSQAAYAQALQISGFATGVVQGWTESLTQGPEKKLIEAAQQWVRGRPPIDDTPLKALKAMGVPEALIEQARAAIAARNERTAFLVWPENWHALQLFVGMATQWRWVVGTKGGRRTGMVYGSLDEVRRSVKSRVAKELRKRRGQLLEQLQAMEDAVIKEGL